MTKPILIDIPEEMRGERTLVRPYRAGDGAGLFEAIDESREHILPWMPWGPLHACVEDTEAFVRGCSARWILREDLPVAIVEAETGRILGGSGLHRIDWTVRSFEIGYWIRKSATGRGHVTEAARLLTQLAFDHLEAKRVMIRVSTNNEKSAAIPPRLGFQVEGIMRNNVCDANGELHDVTLYSMTPEEWAKQR